MRRHPDPILQPAQGHATRGGSRASNPQVSDAHTLSTSLWLPRPRPNVFAFFADARNLEAITPPFLRFVVVTRTPVAMHVGATIDYRLRLHGLPLRWQTEITAWEPPARFVDSQRRGPYAEWVHTHTFDEHDDGTLVRDWVRYRLSGPTIAARLVNAWLVAPDTRRIFEYRHAALERAFGCEGAAIRGDVVIA